MDKKTVLAAVVGAVVAAVSVIVLGNEADPVSAQPAPTAVGVRGGSAAGRQVSVNRGGAAVTESCDEPNEQVADLEKEVRNLEIQRAFLRG